MPQSIIYPGNWLAWVMIFIFFVVFALFFWQIKKQGLLKKDSEDIKYTVFEEDEQDFDDVI